MGAQHLLPGIRYQHGCMPDARVPIILARVVQRHWMVPSDPHHIAKLVDEVEAVLHVLPLDPKRISDFVLAVSELIQNPFLHADKGEQLHVEVSVIYLPGVGVYVGVSDALGSMDPAVFEREIAEVEIMAEHGRGIPLMRAFSSLILYTEDDQWKEIILGLSAE